MAVAMLASLGLACLDSFFANCSVVGASAASANTAQVAILSGLILNRKIWRGVFT